MLLSRPVRVFHSLLSTAGHHTAPQPRFCDAAIAWMADLRRVRYRHWAWDFDDVYDFMRTFDTTVLPVPRVPDLMVAELIGAP